MMKYKDIADISRKSFKRRCNAVSVENLNLNQNVVNNIPLINNETITFADSSNAENVINDVCDLESNHEYSDSSHLSDSSDEEDATGSSTKLLDFLSTWHVENQLPARATNQLLRFLKFNGHPSVPLDSRTLVQTPKGRDIILINPGQYIHFGLSTQLHNILDQYNLPNIPNELVLDFNVDGVPIYKSSKLCFWPILTRIVNSNINHVFVVGIYCGKTKPKCFKQFMRMLVDDIKSIILNFVYKNTPIEVKIRIFICDAPAKADVSGIKSHGGYYCCSKCTVEGEYFNNRVVYPIDENALQRTNESFRARQDENHHRFTSPLEEVLSIDMVKAFPLDYMHVVLLGVVRRIMNVWLNGKLPIRLCSHDVGVISSALVKLSSTQPSDFQRRIRSLVDFGFFKATEFRTFLLYSGPFVLKDVLSFEFYQHFMLLHVSISILCNKEICKEKASVAKNMITEYVVQAEQLYGKEQLTYNMHALIHLPDDVILYGCLDEFSAFPFECYNYKIKRMLKKNNQELAQISNRIFEMNNKLMFKTKNESVFPILSKRNHNGNRFTKFETPCFVIDSSQKNRWMLTVNKNIIKFIFMEKHNENYLIWASEIQLKGDFYEYPLQSSKIDIYKTNQIESTPCFWNYEEISKKLFCMEQETEYIFFPLIHT